MTRRETFAAISYTAYHEAGHAVATILAFRNAEAPLLKQPSLPVKYVEINERASGWWDGICFGPCLYAPEYAGDPAKWRDAMEWQVVINIAGGIAEAIHRGERSQGGVLWEALCNCGMDTDIEEIDRILTALRELTGHRYGYQRFAVRALKLLLQHWGAVEAIAAALIERHRLDGREVAAMVEDCSH